MVDMPKTPVPRQYRFGVAIAFILTSTALVAGNLVTDGSFERGGGGWTNWGNYARESASASEGQIYLIVSNCAQDIPTDIGQRYYLRFSTKRQGIPTVTFAGQPVLLSNPPTNGSSQYWITLEAYVVATTNISRLLFNSGYLDDVQLISTHDPVQIIAEPQSTAGVHGGAAAFRVKAEGGPPVSYTWLHDGTPAERATNATLLLTRLQAAEAGAYTVVVSNVINVVTSTPAILTVEAGPQVPQIVLQPSGDTCIAGYKYSFAVSVIGEEPFRYQWLFHGTNIVAATNRVLEINSIQLTDAGIYSVRVENAFGSTLSLPATLQVTTVPGGGYVLFDNSAVATRQVIFDADGVTKLAGAPYVAQLYAGRGETLLRPVDVPHPFLPFLPGYFNGGSVLIPDVPQGETVYVQTRVWEAASGVSFEDARARGGKYGFGPIFGMTTVAPPPAPGSRVPMASFSLNAGFPLFTTGKVEVNARGDGQSIEWKLTGAAGARYLIERRTPPQNWAPLMVVTNTSGTVLFSDTNQTEGSASFYRSRMLD